MVELYSIQMAFFQEQMYVYILVNTCNKFGEIRNYG